MKNLAKYRVRQLYNFLREAMPVMILGILVFFGAAILGFQQDNRRILEDTRATVKNTETIVEKQNEILDAIRQLSLDNKLTSKQLGDTIICMLLVPVNQRTTQTKEHCRNQAIYATSVADVEPFSAPPQSEKPKPKPDTTPPRNNPPNPVQSLLEVLTQPVRDIMGLLGRGA